MSLLLIEGLDGGFGINSARARIELESSREIDEFADAALLGRGGAIPLSALAGNEYTREKRKSEKKN